MLSICVCSKNLLKTLWEKAISSFHSVFYPLKELSHTFIKFKIVVCRLFNPLPHMPNLGSSNSSSNKNIMSKIWGAVISLSRKYCGKRRNCS